MSLITEEMFVNLMQLTKPDVDAEVVYAFCCEVERRHKEQRLAAFERGVNGAWKKAGEVVRDILRNRRIW